MFYHFKVKKSGRFFWAECIELGGCQTQAESMVKLKKNMEEALNLYLDEPEDSKVIFPFPLAGKQRMKSFQVPVDPKIAFAFLLRQSRLQHGMTQRQAAEKMGFCNIYSYQRLESSCSANPELDTLIKIKTVFRDFKTDLIFSR